MDIMTPAERSARMSLIRSRDTQPEIIVRRLVHGLHYRYRLHVAGLPGRPDLVFKGRRKVIFVHGCFWHLHRGCVECRPPKSKLEYWRPKLEGNVARDDKTRRQLAAMGWKCLVIWECETGDRVALTRRIVAFLDN